MSQYKLTFVMDLGTLVLLESILFFHLLETKYIHIRKKAIDHIYWNSPQLCYYQSQSAFSIKNNKK